MCITKALASGVAGACVLTLIHESARRIIPHAPRADVIGMRAIAKSMRSMGRTPPSQNVLHKWALGGDVASNGIYYSLVGVGDRAGVWKRGAFLGILGGIGAAFLSRPLGLGRMPNHRTPWTQLLTICWYTLGALTAAATADALENG